MPDGCSSHGGWLLMAGVLHVVGPILRTDSLYAVFDRYSARSLEAQSALNTVAFTQWMLEIDEHNV
jgi:hypothetical protein